MENSSTTEKVIQLLEEQLAYMKKQNEELSIKLDHSSPQNKTLAEQNRQLTKALYGSKSEKSKYQAPNGQGSLFEDAPSFSESEHTEEQRRQLLRIQLFVNYIKNEMIRFVMELKSKKFIIILKTHNVTVALVK